MLSVEKLTCAYGRIEVLHGASVEVRAGEVVALLGANGAGKTTLLRAISGVQAIAQGSIRFDGNAIEALPGHARVALGIIQVPEGRQLFAPLSVEDNLKLGAWSRRSAGTTSVIERVFAMFPALGEMRKLPAGALSGGQQQMLAIQFLVRIALSHALRLLQRLLRLNRQLILLHRSCQIVPCTQHTAKALQLKTPQRPEAAGSHWGEGGNRQ